MTRVVACVPTIDLSPYLDDLVHALDRDSVRVRLYVNSEHVTEHELQLTEGWPVPDRPETEHFWARQPELMHMPGESIYSEWNHAAAWARELDAHLLCVTDDVVLTPRHARELSWALDAREDYGLISTDVHTPVSAWAPSDVVPTSHQAGNRYEFATWCFIANPHMWVDVDPRYRIWYGDDDLIWKMNEAGHGVGYLRGIGVTHHTSTTSNQVDWVRQAAGEDGQLWASTH